jgi:hypothetical protein
VEFYLELGAECSSSIFNYKSGSEDSHYSAGAEQRRSGGRKGWNVNEE